MFRTLARVLIILAFALSVNGPVFACAMPMQTAKAQVTGMASLCSGRGCAGYHGRGHAQRHAMNARCIMTLCPNAVALLPTGVSAVASIAATTAYHAPIKASRLGLHPIPDAPPPRSLALS